METDDLEWLATWYQQQCNGIWEHQKGMLLESLSSDARYIVQSTARSGWRLRIDLRGTSAAGSASRHLAVCDFHGKWLRCDLNAQSFEGQGADVEELINVFRNWVDTQSSVLAPAFVS